MKIPKVCAVIALLLGISLMSYAGVQLMATQQIYRQGNEAYANLSALAMVKASAAAPGPAASATPQARAAIPGLEIDFAALQEVNKDVAAWLYSPDTVIGYPVMKADDYAYYLKHLPDGSMNSNGALFIDYNHAADFSGKLTVIYGHHMKSGKMFGSLKGYKGQKYYEEHPLMYLYTEEGNYQIELLYGCVIGAGQWRDRAFMFEENLEALLAYAAHNTTFTSGAQYEEGDSIVALATCSYEFDNARYVLLGILRPQY
jgi:sortase B